MNLADLLKFPECNTEDEESDMNNKDDKPMGQNISKSLRKETNSLSNKNSKAKSYNIKSNRGYKCNVCSKRFRYLYLLKAHHAIHSNEGLFQCEFCTERFKWEATVNRHQVTHSQERPFQCKLCTYKNVNEKII